ncbi:MAG: ATP-binding protein, partial [bacterium]
VLPLIKELLELLEPKLTSERVRYHLRVAEGICVQAHREGLRQALLNVIINALEAMDKPDKEIEIEAREKGSKVLLSVADSGPGVPESEREKIFDVFHSTKPYGSGFGLAIARRLIEQNGGRLWAENHRLGGAAFYFELSRASKPAPISSEGKESREEILVRNLR